MSEDVYEVNMIDASKVAFQLTSGGVLAMLEKGDEASRPGGADGASGASEVSEQIAAALAEKQSEYGEIILYRTFPFSMVNRFISVRTVKGEEIGVIADLADLDADSQTAAYEALSIRYILPKVIRVESIKQNPGMWTWQLDTTLGPINLVMRNLHEHVQMIGNGRILLTDINGNRCEIPDISSLDTQSRKQLNRVL